MATLVCFHAHPDDESIATGGTMLAASKAGHRVVLVLATKGEMGEPVDGVLHPGEELGDRRTAEALAAAEILGVHRVEFLGYRDSGMIDEPSNDDASCFWQADVNEAAAKLQVILEEESADILTVYDDHGGYGHPDHIQVHRVGIQAAAQAGVDNVFWSTMNRTAIQELMAAQAEQLAEHMEEPLETVGDDFGTIEAEITHAIDVSAVVDAKRRAMAAHASQISEETFFLQMPDEAFAQAFGTEWYVRPGHPRPSGAPFGTDLFA